MSSAIVFDGTNGRDDAAFHKWIKRNQNGYVINTFRGLSRDFARLHYSACRSLEQAPRATDENPFTGRQYIKLCSNNIEDLGKALSEGGIGEVWECKICKLAPEFVLDHGEPTDDEDARKRILVSIRLRQGQGKFRDDLLDAYDRSCCITGYDVVDALEAAHIRPYDGKRTNIVQNGLLLRADLHTLFDLGLITIDHKNMKVIVDHELTKSTYADLQGRLVSLPSDKAKWPDASALEDHRKRAKERVGRSRR